MTGKIEIAIGIEDSIDSSLVDLIAKDTAVESGIAVGAV